MRISILGAPGSGKTTQSQLLAKSLNVPVFSINDELRQLAKSNDPRSGEVREVLEKDELVPDELALSLLRERLSQSDAERGFVLDGTPRTVGEARVMMGVFALNRVFHLQVGFQVAMERLMRRAREDDKPESIRRRFEIYRKEIKAILPLYRSLGILVEIDAATGSIQDVSQEIMSKLQ